MTIKLIREAEYKKVCDSCLKDISLDREWMEIGLKHTDENLQNTGMHYFHACKNCSIRNLGIFLSLIKEKHAEKYEYEH